MKPSLHIAVVGAGPAGMYATGHLLEQREFSVSIDIFDRLPTPWGLVRAGVAPDHPEKKWVADRLFEFHLNNPNVNFIGNVEIGRDISIEELNSRYNAVIYSVGSSSDNSLDIPGEDLKGALAAREFVAWYNGHPDYRDLKIDLSHERAIVIGNGNVALDVARILTLPLNLLKKTDIASHAIDTLKISKVREVVLVGRRDCTHSSFSNPELEELNILDDVDISVEGGTLDSGNNHDWQTRRKIATLKGLSSNQKSSARKKIVFKFLTSPVSINGKCHVQSLTVRRNRLLIKDGCQYAQGTDIKETLETGLVLRAIGYRGTALPGLPFDEKKGIVPNIDGRIKDSYGCITGSYVTGWIKRGPKGIIGTNKKCAYDTVRHLLDDARNGLLNKRTDAPNSIKNLLRERQLTAVSKHQWQQLDRLERLAGKNQQRPRVKFTRIKDMMDSIL